MQLKAYDFRPQKHAGNNPDVVLIHGTGGDASLWRRQVNLLVDHGFRCVLPELRGHGGTPEPGDITGLQVHIDDVIDTLEASNVRYPAVFVGHSLGAIISVALAQQKPELFVQVLAVCMPGQVLPIVADLFEIFLRSPYDKLQRTWLYEMLPKRLQVLLRTERHSLRQIVDNFRQASVPAEQINLSFPVHFCAGARDIVARSHQVKRIHEQLPNSTFRLFERSGHCCMDDEPEEFNSWFLEKVLGVVPANGATEPALS